MRAECSAEQCAERDRAVVEELHADSYPAEQVAGTVGLPEVALDHIAADDAYADGDAARTTKGSRRPGSARVVALAAPMTPPTLIPAISAPTVPGLPPTSRMGKTTRIAW